MNKIGHYTGLTNANGFVFCSGQVGIDEATGCIAAGMETQTKLAIKSIEKLLVSQDLDLSAIVKTTVYITHEDYFEEMNRAYKDVFGDALPARTTVIVSGLPKDPSEGPESILVEIEAIAVANLGSAQLLL